MMKEPSLVSIRGRGVGEGTGPGNALPQPAVEVIHQTAHKSAIAIRVDRLVAERQGGWTGRADGRRSLLAFPSAHEVWQGFADLRGEGDDDDRGGERGAMIEAEGGPQYLWTAPARHRQSCGIHHGTRAS